ncbi:hypothetical protein OG806_00790 [Streptomyces sp. NBC_00882]|uniref:hypothetical protein n=1 Tax=Streptomyces TaxID=1883 RepID=UPI00386550D2|nr:hypothetical protein OG806_00790 [Streptomyces sp. NBC_00882]WSZ55122.1 hypothetical protein OH824_00380 [Streptomyces canus]
MTTENIIWAAVLDQRGLSRSLISYLFRVGENQMRGLIKQVRPHLEDLGHHSEPIPARLIDPSDLANYVMHATVTDRERETPHYCNSSTAPGIACWPTPVTRPAPGWTCPAG